MGRYAKKKNYGGGGAVIASDKLIKVYLLWPIRYRLNK